MQDVSAQNAVLACEGINNDLTDGRAVGEVVERAPMPFDPVPTQLRCLVEPGRRQTNARLLGHLGGARKAIGLATNCHIPVRKPHIACRALMQLSQMVCHTPPDRVAGDLDGHAI